jgi:polyisoprenoid-binding protein YceI
MSHCWPVLVALALFAGGVSAEGVIVDRSEIRFVSKQMGVNVEGRFRKWKANIVFRPEALAKSKAELDIDLASVDLASSESEEEARSASWFDTAKFPVARFVSTSIRHVGGDRYEMTGKLSLKGITRDCVVPVTLRQDASGNRTAEGRVTVNRLDFRIGDGAWSDPDMVANEVVVSVRMALAPG